MRFFHVVRGSKRVACAHVLCPSLGCMVVCVLCARRWSKRGLLSGVEVKNSHLPNEPMHMRTYPIHRKISVRARQKSHAPLSSWPARGAAPLWPPRAAAPGPGGGPRAPFVTVAAPARRRPCGPPPFLTVPCVPARAAAPPALEVLSQPTMPALKSLDLSDQIGGHHH